MSGFTANHGTDLQPIMVLSLVGQSVSVLESLGHPVPTWVRWNMKSGQPCGAVLLVTDGLD